MGSWYLKYSSFGTVSLPLFTCLQSKKQVKFIKEKTSLCPFTVGLGINKSMFHKFLTSTEKEEKKRVTNF